MGNCCSQDPNIVTIMQLLAIAELILESNNNETINDIICKYNSECNGDIALFNDDKNFRLTMKRNFKYELIYNLILLADPIHVHIQTHLTICDKESHTLATNSLAAYDALKEKISKRRMHEIHIILGKITS